jgi:tetratricopeptide (TPR) repeat protein
LEPSFVTQQIDGEAAWEQYQAARRRSLLGLSPLVLRNPLKKLLLEHSQRIAGDYRNSDAPLVREGDWQRCQRYMLWTRQLDASDNKAAAMHAYASGHISRINRKDAEAISSFQRAASLDPNWPDPHLGMARVYIYGLKDFESGIKSLKRAETLGHRPGKRESGQLADALKNRGLQYWKVAAQLRDQPQEKDLLSKARSDLAEAIDIYAQIAPWGDSTAQIKSVQGVLEKIDSRLDLIDPVGSIFSWKWWKRW